MVRDRQGPCTMLPTVQLSTRIKDAGIAVRHSRGHITSILQGPEMRWRGWALVGDRHKKEIDPMKHTFML